MDEEMMDIEDVTDAEATYWLSLAKGTRTPIACPKCGASLIVREGYSKFLGCAKYPKCCCKVGLSAHPLSRPTMDEEMICLDCSWAGPESELNTTWSHRMYKNSVCPKCYSDHVDYVKRIRRNSAQTKA